MRKADLLHPSPSLLIRPAIYLRKSRAEEHMSNEETLGRHRAALFAYAAKYNLTIREDDIYQEVVSGESLFARPKMLELLEAVTNGSYDVVLCMDMQRLGRGGMYDQGAILDAFKFTETMILTPERIYDLCDEMDEEAAEMETFISRREYKLITKRLRRGLNQSIAAGAYTPNAPYGYRKTTVGKLPSLEIIPEEAEIVRRIFQLYADGFGCTIIEREINALGARGRRGSRFNRNTIRVILSNPVYIGKIRWNKTSHVKTGVGAARETKVVCNPREYWKLYDGQHQAIISEELWEAVQAQVNSKYRLVCNHTPSSPLAGLVRCGVCGRPMNMQGSNKGVPYLLCPTTGCCAGAKFDYVESVVLVQLQMLMEELQLEVDANRKTDVSDLDRMIQKAEGQLAKLEERRERLYAFLEDGTYTKEVFVDRMDKLSAEEAALRQVLAQQEEQRSRALAVNKERQLELLRTALALYDGSDVVGKKELLRSVVEVITYTKEKKTKPADFKLSITLREFI